MKACLIFLLLIMTGSQAEVVAKVEPKEKYGFHLICGSPMAYQTPSRVILRGKNGTLIVHTDVCRAT
jgi:hypothetical protein